MPTLETAYKKVKELVKAFKENEASFLAPAYSEAEVRDDFIDEFFIALGWNVTHINEKNPYRQEVKIEKSVTDENKRKRRADYAFSLAPNYKNTIFIVEAKKPARDLLNADDYFQSIRYATNTNTPIVILTDFEEFHVIDARFKTTVDTALNRKIKEYRYHDYADKEKFAEIYYLFSREAVADNSIQEYAASLPIPKSKAALKTYLPKGTKSVDESLLDELEEIREVLAKAFKKTNPSLDSYELTEATQRTIDRLVFLRFLEDKLLEPELFVSRFARSKTPWKDFTHDCILLNEKYNGVVFRRHFIDESAFKPPAVKTFIDVCIRLTNPDYYYDVIPIHILGSIYERFLGSVVHATAKQVTVQQKPEVKKAGGVYYTPEYIVSYIVENTIGKLIEDKSPLQISRMRFADIACGSGSFLISAFGFILDYHSHWYNDNPRKAKEDGCIYIKEDDHWVVSLKQKREILVNNIYGVDIDEQAVEVTELSLYLKLLEDETTATAHEMSSLFTLLPDLSGNIICGNSLIEPDILMTDLFSGEGEERKLNPMAFESVFTEVMDKGGFDAIVGNPPYVEFKQLDKGIKNILELSYTTTKGKYDLFIPFIERGINLIKPSGLISFIVPSMFSKRDFGNAVRKFISKEVKAEQLTWFGDFQVFNQVTIYPLIFVFAKKLKKGKTKITYFPSRKGLNHSNIAKSLFSSKSDDFSDKYLIDSNSFDEKEWELSKQEFRDIKYKLEHHNTETLQSITKYIFVGIQSGKDSVFFVSDDDIKNYSLEKDIVLPIYRGRDIVKYDSSWSKTYIIYPYDKETNIPINEKDFKNNYPNVYRYLCGRRVELSGRTYFDNSAKLWFELWCERSFKKFKEPKIICAEISPENRFYLDEKGFLGNTKTFNIVLNDKWGSDYLYVLGLLNSKVLEFYHKQISVPKAGGFFEYKTQFLNHYPIRVIDFSNKTEKAAHDKIVRLVDQMLEAKKKLATATSDRDKDYYARRTTSIDLEINKEVYKLYGLSKDEIEIVETQIKK